jgi:hydrogenase maturation factor
VSACEPQPGAHCITCGDVGTPMRVIEAEAHEAVCVDDDGISHRVAVDLVAPVQRGDSLLIHAGVAIGAAGG